MKYADLQLHTSYSDGAETPLELMVRAKKGGFSCIAITDHDTTGAFPEAFDIAEKTGIEVIQGIEISCNCSKGTLHMLGYYIDIHHPVFQASVRYFRDARRRRIDKISGELKRNGVEISVQDIMSEVKGESAGRPHVANALIKKGYAANRQEAFDKYLAKGKPGHVPKTKMKPHEAINLIHLAGGVAILAHPHSLLDLDVIRRLAIYGLDGIEVFYPEHTPAFIEKLKKYVDKYHLLITGGSDCHGSGKDEIRMGKIKLPYSYVETLKKFYYNKHGISL